MLVALLVGAYLAARAAGLTRLTDPAQLSAAVRGLRERRFIAPAFVGAYALATALALPGSVLTIAGGAIFGFRLGVLLNWTGALLGATLAYLLARALGADALRRVLGGRADRLEALAGSHGFGTVLRLRLIPVVPFNLLNFAAGLARVPLRDYLLGTALGLIPGTVVYTWFADALLAGAAGARRDALVRLAIAGAVLILLSFAPALARRLGWSKAAPALLVATLLLPAAAHAQATAGGRTFDHSAFDGLLRAHVADGLVDYDAFARAPEFARYLAALSTADPAALPEPERLAFWINGYHAYTIQLIVAHGERESIRNINRSFGFLKLKGPWSERLVRAGGRSLTLDDVEHGIIRREFQEPRIHFALVCAAIGCPPLRAEAYTGRRLDAQLEDQGRLFLLASPAKNRVDVEGRVLHVSMIFIRYREDFGGTGAAVGRYIAHWYPAGPARSLLLAGDFRTVETNYDWTLNSQRSGRGSR